MDQRKLSTNKLGQQGEQLLSELAQISIALAARDLGPAEALSFVLNVGRTAAAALNLRVLEAALIGLENISWDDQQRASAELVSLRMTTKGKAQALVDVLLSAAQGMGDSVLLPRAEEAAEESAEGRKARLKSALYFLVSAGLDNLAEQGEKRGAPPPSAIAAEVRPWAR